MAIGPKAWAAVPQATGLITTDLDRRGLGGRRSRKVVGVLRSLGLETSAATGHWPQVIGERPLGMENIQRGLTDLLNLFLGPDGHGGRRSW